jgi:hypothetical protein
MWSLTPTRVIWSFRSQSFIEQQSSLAVQLDFAGQSEAYSLEGHRFVGCRCSRRYGQGDLLEILLRVKAEYAVGAKNEIEVAAVLIGVDLTPEFG